MEEKDWLYLISEQNRLQQVMEMNRKTERFGLTLTEEEAKLLVEMGRESLKEQQRVEFGEGILPKLIYRFCDSPYIDQSSYGDILIRLQEIFYLYKGESMDGLTDDELLDYMKEAFDGECSGSLELLEDTAMEEFAKNVRREGYGFFGNKKGTGRGENEYE